MKVVTIISVSKYVCNMLSSHHFKCWLMATGHWSSHQMNHNYLRVSCLHISRSEMGCICRWLTHTIHGIDHTMISLNKWLQVKNLRKLLLLHGTETITRCLNREANNGTSVERYKRNQFEFYVKRRDNHIERKESDHNAFRGDRFVQRLIYDPHILELRMHSNCVWLLRQFWFPSVAKSLIPKTDRMWF